MILERVDVTAFFLRAASSIGSQCGELVAPVDAQAYVLGGTKWAPSGPLRSAAISPAPTRHARSSGPIGGWTNCVHLATMGTSRWGRFSVARRVAALFSASLALDRILEAPNIAPLVYFHRWRQACCPKVGQGVATACGTNSGLGSWLWRQGS